MSYYNRRGERITHDEWVSAPDNRVAWDMVGGVRISTAWLGLDHQFGGGPPLIFETMLFGKAFDFQGERYSTEAEALAGHAEWVATVRASHQT